MLEPPETVTVLDARSGSESETIAAVRMTSRRLLGLFIGFTCDSGSMLYVFLLGPIESDRRRGDV